jgi:hypothetical protein
MIRIETAVKEANQLPCGERRDGSHTSSLSGLLRQDATQNDVEHGIGISHAQFIIDLVDAEGGALNIPSEKQLIAGAQYDEMKQSASMDLKSPLAMPCCNSRCWVSANGLEFVLASSRPSFGSSYIWWISRLM